ncbi:MAG: hypothetical protein F6J96_21475 [Symploca sp. SIO1C2]|nr:hypothetical protein [Symploca sp. SIO1C2]
MNKPTSKSEINYKINRFLRAATAALIPYYWLILISPSYAEVPQKAVVRKIIGKPEMWVTKNGRRYQAQEDSIMEKYRDKINVNGNSQTRAILEFLSRSNQNLNLFVKTLPHSDPSIYNFPCNLQQGSYLFGWKRAANRASACERAVQVRSGDWKSNSQQPNWQYPAVARQLFKHLLINQSYNYNRTFYYCSVVAESGASWLDIQSKDPCQEIMEKCESNPTNGQCIPLTLSYWKSQEPELTAVVECNPRELFITKGTGSELKELAKQKWDEAMTQGATSCALQVYQPGDVAIELITDPSILNQGNNQSPIDNIDHPEVAVNSRSTSGCAEFEIVWGAVIAKSAKRPQGIRVDSGYKSTPDFCKQTVGEIEEFDVESKRQSIDFEIIDADNRGLEFCNKQQVSGGQEGDQRIIQLTSNQGVIHLEYEMYTAKDKLQVFYEGKELYNTGFTSGSNSISIPFQGNSGRVEVVLTGNIEESGTEWNYTIFCPIK